MLKSLTLSRNSLLTLKSTPGSRKLDVLSLRVCTVAVTKLPSVSVWPLAVSTDMYIGRPLPQEIQGTPTRAVSLQV